MEIKASIPEELVPKIAAAFQTAYPELTQGLSPSKAINAVVIYWVRTTLVNYVSNQVRSQAEAAVIKATMARDLAVETAVKQVMTQTEGLVSEILNPTPPPPPPVEEPPVEEPPAPGEEPPVEAPPVEEPPADEPLIELNINLLGGGK